QEFAAASLIHAAAEESQRAAVGRLHGGIILVRRITEIHLHRVATRIIAVNEPVIDQDSAAKADDRSESVNGMIGAVRGGKGLKVDVRDVKRVAETVQCDYTRAGERAAGVEPNLCRSVRPGRINQDAVVIG